jgi:hypothetical protein
MKKLLALVSCVLIMALLVPVDAVFAQEEDELKVELTYLRYRFNHFFESAFMTDDSAEYFDDDLDIKFEISKGDVLVHMEFETADSAMGDDRAPQESYSDAVKDYYGQWTPEALADNEFTLKAGKFDSVGGFGKMISNDDGYRGSVSASWKINDVAIVLGYGKRYEGETNDDIEGDDNSFRAKVAMPLGESFTLTGYGAFYTKSDIILQEAVAATDTTGAVPEVQGDGSVFIGGVNLDGSLNNISLFAEAGFTSGSEDQAVNNAAVEYDLAGFYATGGASYTFGQVTLGVEAGFGSGDDDASDDSIDDFLGINNDYGFDEVIEDEILDNGLRNKIFVKATAAIAPTEKLNLDGAVIYVKPTEEFVSSVTGKEVDTYGFEFDATMTYKLAANLKYVLMGAVASVEEDWFDESSQYQVMNRLEFLF